jgi:Mn2+/Fe2+ NRAMP family transporter
MGQTGDTMDTEPLHRQRLGRRASPRQHNASWLSKLGPGLITGAADDDPSGIATYSQAGAQFGLQMLWTCC